MHIYYILKIFVIRDNSLDMLDTKLIYKMIKFKIPMGIELSYLKNRMS